MTVVDDGTHQRHYSATIATLESSDAVVNCRPPCSQEAQGGARRPLPAEARRPIRPTKVQIRSRILHKIRLRRGVCSRGACIIRAAVTRWSARQLFGGPRACSSSPPRPVAVALSLETEHVRCLSGPRRRGATAHDSEAARRFHLRGRSPSLCCHDCHHVPSSRRRSQPDAMMP